MSEEKIFVEAGMRIRALRGNATQSDVAERLGVNRKTVERWEAGERLPDGQSLLALMNVFGADVNYILTGNRAGSAPVVLTAEEQTMLGYFREASKEVRRAALGALLGAASSGQVGGAYSQHSTGDGAVQIGSIGGKLTGKKGR